jgi:hypothetical protein
MNAQLQTRPLFSESMHNDLFTVSGQQSSTGQTAPDFGNVVLKELIDNALDACESAGIEPRINVTTGLNTNGQMVLTVSDNAGGLSRDVIEKILDFSTRNSTNAVYKSPTRGAQGNALKTILCIPTALKELGGGLVVIESKGLRHEISFFNVSYSGFSAETLHNVTPIVESIGTSVSVVMPKLNETKPDYWVKAFALFNPHCWVNFENKLSMVNRDSIKPVFYPKLTDCKKITPDKPTNAHSYNEPAFLKHAAYHGEQTKITVYEYARTFQGLTNKKIVSPIIDVLNLSGARVSDIYNDRAKVTALHSAMKVASKPIQHKHLGAIGETNLLARLENVTRNAYRKIEGLIDGVPYVFEVLIAECSDREGEFLGVNHSPTYKDFLSDCYFRVDKVSGFGIRGLMDSVIDRTKYTFICHLIGIGLNFKDKGKTSVELPDSVQNEIAAAIVQVGKSIKRGSSNVVQFEGENKTVSFKKAVVSVLPDAIAKATDNNRLPANVRSVYYKVREFIQEFKNGELTYKNFNTILTDYWLENGRNKMVYNDPRGLLYEPHNDAVLPLGSMEVDGYEFPTFQFDKILFIEKKGLWHTVKSAGLHKKYDMAVIASEGFATVATRDLLERAQTCENMTIFSLHDADPAGYEIARTLQEATRAMPNHNITVIDLGLFVQDALDIGIEPETFFRTDDLSEKLVTRLNPIEREHFEGVVGTRKKGGKTINGFECKRIELNALSAGQLVQYIDNGIARAITDNKLTNKVIPPETVLNETAADLRTDKLKTLALNALIEKYAINEKVNQFVQAMTFDDIEFAGDVGGYLISNELETWRDGLNDLTDNQIAANQSVIDDLINGF